jgi:pectate lyase
MPDPRVGKPQTCESLGHVCGTPQDGWGGTLSCGVCGDGEMCSSGTCIDASPPPPPPPTGTPYGHVVPSDVGVTVGVGVVAPVPTAPYTGPQTITTPGTVIENVVFPVDMCPRIEADNVTLRNVIMKGACFYGTSIGHSPATDEYINNVTIEYSKLEVTGGGKVVRINHANNVTVRNNEILGGQDFFWMDFGSDWWIENNYMHSMTGDSGSHADGFQWGGANRGGDVYIRGNWVEKGNDETTGNDLVFLTGIQTLHIENNYFTPWGWRTLRCTGIAGASCLIKNNIYAQVFKDTYFPEGSGRDAVLFTSDTAPVSTFECNRYEDGTFITQDRVNGDVTHVITGCPSYP